jgi:NarL family two-component system response regulator LiaR
MQMSDTKTIKVMIVDDHPIVRDDGLKSVLLAADDLELVGEAGNGREAVARCQESRPDVILMDVVMPGMDGLEATRAILGQYPDVKIVVLTTFPEEGLVEKALEAGAVGYMLKNTPANKLADAIRAAYAGEPALAPEATQALIKTRIRGRKLGDDLSPREKEVLVLLVEGLSNDEIAERLVISPGTVRHHVSACITKLGASNRTHAAALAVEHQLTP